MEEETQRRRGRPPVVREPDLEEEETVLETNIDPGFERVIVARGKTVVTPHPTETKILRMGEDGKVVRAPTHLEYGEMSEVRLERDEAERLIALGIVHRPGEAQMIPYYLEHHGT